MLFQAAAIDFVLLFNIKNSLELELSIDSTEFTLERLRFGFQNRNRYLNLPFSQSDVPHLPD